MTGRKAVLLARDSVGPHQRNWGVAFAEGLRRHGWRTAMEGDYARGDLFVLWGCRRSDNIARAIKDGAEVCVIERGYVDDRFSWCSVSFGGGLNGRGVFRGPLDDPSRWDKHFSHLMQPWRDDRKGYALIMGQVPGDTAVRAVDLPKFYQNAQAAFERLGVPVRMREHPGASRGNAVPLSRDLAKAACAVTWNSNSGVDAVLAGVPAVAMDEGSMAWDVTGHELKVPPAPDRAAWAHAIAWKQWTKDEMASGYCWDMVGHG